MNNKRRNYKNILSLIMHHADLDTLKVLYNHLLEVKVETKNDKVFIKHNNIRLQTIEFLDDCIQYKAEYLSRLRPFERYKFKDELNDR